MLASLVIAAHNEGESLAKTTASCIESCAGLDHEIIIADDASDDGSVESAEKQFPRTRVVRSDVRLGASPAKALGARSARGETLVFLDGHTKPESGAILRLVENVELLKGEAIFTPAVPALDTKRWKNACSQVGRGYTLDLEKFGCGWCELSQMREVTIRRRRFHESPALIGCALAVSRELYDELWGFDPHMRIWGVEDLDFGLKCWLMGKRILHDSEAVIGHRFRASFDNYSVPFEHVVANQLRMARKNFTRAVWSEWVDRCRGRHSGRLAEHPEGLWARVWSLFEADQDSVEAERAFLHSHRVRDEFWYAERFGLTWPKLEVSASQSRTLLAAAEPSASPSPPPLFVDLDIIGVPEGDEETLGGLVVKNADGNGALRKAITLKTSIATGNVILTRSNAKVRVFKADVAGTEITFNGVDNKFPVASLPMVLSVEGAIESGSMRDVSLELTHDTVSPVFDRVKFTVLWVEITTRHNSGQVSTDNSARDNYKALRFPPSFDLGFGMTLSDGSVAGTPNFTGTGNGSEFIGTVSPSDFVPTDFGGALRLNREIVSGRLWFGTNGNQNDAHGDNPPGADTTGNTGRDDDPQSEDSGGKIYDLDAPGLDVQTSIPTANYVYRARVNFKAWAEWKFGSVWIRCSEKKEWFSRTSVKLTGKFEMNFVDSSTATTLKRDAATWTVDEWAGCIVNIVGGIGNPQARRVTGNTANTITVSPGWGTKPDAPTSVYRLITPSSWTKLSDVANDNQNGDGTTNLSWNLE